MEDLEQPDTPTVNSRENEPQGNADPNDPLRPDLDEENNAGGTPPMADPHADTEVHDAEFPSNDQRGTREGDNGGNPENTDMAVDDNEDNDSELEELDEQQFDDFDAANLTIPDRPIEVDESNVALLGVHKRKRTAEEEAERERKKKRKEKKREKPSRKKKGGDEDEFEGGVEMDGKRVRKSKSGADGKPKGSRRERTPVNEDDLTPEERKSPMQYLILRAFADLKQDVVVRSTARSMRRSKHIESPVGKPPRIWKSGLTRNWSRCARV
jgi:transcription factor SPN1